MCDRTSQESKPISERIFEALAKRESVEPADLAIPLYESVDPDALDALFRSAGAGPDDATIQVEFTHGEHDVLVTADGSVRVSKAAREPSPGGPGTRP